MPPTYEIVSIKRAEPPPNTEGASWYDYVIAAVATYFLLSYVDSAIFVVTVGAGVGGLFGWVARKM